MVQAGKRASRRERMYNSLVIVLPSLPHGLDGRNEPWKPPGRHLVMPQRTAELEFKPDLNIVTCFKARVQRSLHLLNRWTGLLFLKAIRAHIAIGCL